MRKAGSQDRKSLGDRGVDQPGGGGADVLQGAVARLDQRDSSDSFSKEMPLIRHNSIVKPVTLLSTNSA
jgi:hypothetical protein